MARIVAAINTTLDGFCDHTALEPDEEVHDHYTELLSNSDIILYGRITYELMKFWKPFLDNPSEERSMNDFAKEINRIQKILFSHNRLDPDWNTAVLSEMSLTEKVKSLKSAPGKDVLVGSRSLIVQLINHQLLDELQLCIHPLIAAGGLPLFDSAEKRNLLKVTGTKTFRSGAVIMYLSFNG